MATKSTLIKQAAENIKPQNLISSVENIIGAPSTYKAVEGASNVVSTPLKLVGIGLAGAYTIPALGGALGQASNSAFTGLGTGLRGGVDALLGNSNIGTNLINPSESLGSESYYNGASTYPDEKVIVVNTEKPADTGFNGTTILIVAGLVILAYVFLKGKGSSGNYYKK